MELLSNSFFSLLHINSSIVELRTIAIFAISINLASSGLDIICYSLLTEIPDSAATLSIVLFDCSIIFSMLFSTDTSPSNAYVS